MDSLQHRPADGNYRAEQKTAADPKWRQAGRRGSAINRKSGINITLRIERDGRNGRFRFKTNGHPVFAVCILLTLIALTYCTAIYIKHIASNYPAYEGTVVEMRRDRISGLFIDESDNNWLLIIQPPGETETIVRMVSDFTRLTKRIKTGDYVRKEKGIFKTVSVIGKKSISELQNEAERALGRN